MRRKLLTTGLGLGMSGSLIWMVILTVKAVTGGPEAEDYQSILGRLGVLLIVLVLLTHLAKRFGKAEDKREVGNLD